MPRSIPTLALGLALLALAPLAPEATAQEITGLSGWSLFIDPGHSQNENVGYAGYSEAKKTLRVGLALRDMLESRTDIGAVVMARTTDQQVVGLTQRTDAANAAGVDFYQSLHSDAGPPSANSTLMLYGGWRQNGETVEKTPHGGQRMGDIMDLVLTDAMRIGGRGNYADRTFYQGFPENHANQYPYLHVNRESNMASMLSEAGFHTSPVQNPRNMNAEWKVLEAQAAFWAILDYHGVARPNDRIATGFVLDGESGIPVNGARIEIAGQTYTTDTYASLFSQYSSDPDELHNGFYYLPGLPAGTHTVTISAPDYTTVTGQITMLEGQFTFFDAALVSTIPPVVTATAPEDGQNPFRITDPIEIDFSRPMDRATTEAAFALAPASGGDAATGAFVWEDGDTRLVFTPEASLDAETDYVLTLAGSATGAAGDPLDGDGDGTGGDAFSVSFTTGFPDTTPPRIAAVYPANNSSGIERLPLLTLTYTEPLDPATVEGKLSLAPTAGGSAVAGAVQYQRLGEQSAISFFPSEPLAANTAYRLEVAPGLQDLFFNEQPLQQRLTFTTGDVTAVSRSIDDFEGDVDAAWWEPQQSGSTTGIVTDSTASGASSEVASLLYGGDTSLRIDYGWNVTDSAWLIRQYTPLSPPAAQTFTSGATLRAAVFGDGSGTLLPLRRARPGQHRSQPLDAHRLGRLAQRDVGHQRRRHRVLDRQRHLRRERLLRLLPALLRRRDPERAVRPHLDRRPPARRVRLDGGRKRPRGRRLPPQRALPEPRPLARRAAAHAAGARGRHRRRLQRHRRRGGATRLWRDVGRRRARARVGRQRRRGGRVLRACPGRERDGHGADRGGAIAPRASGERQRRRRGAWGGTSGAAPPVVRRQAQPGFARAVGPPALHSRRDPWPQAPSLASIHRAARARSRAPLAPSSRSPSGRLSSPLATGSRSSRREASPGCTPSTSSAPSPRHPGSRFRPSRCPASTACGGAPGASP